MLILWWWLDINFISIRSRGWLWQSDHETSFSTLTDPPSEDQGCSSDECASEAQATATASEPDQLRILEGLNAVLYDHHDTDDAPLLDGRDEKSEEPCDKKLPPNPALLYKLVSTCFWFVWMGRLVGGWIWWRGKFTQEFVWPIGDLMPHSSSLMQTFLNKTYNAGFALSFPAWWCHLPSIIKH